MSLVSKVFCFLFYCLIVTEVFPQEKPNTLTNENIGNSFRTSSVYNISRLTPLKKYNTAGVLDSLIYISKDGDRNRIAYNYNDDLSLNYFTNAVCPNGRWIILDKHTNTYNSKGYLESVLWEVFNTSSEEWCKDKKDIYNFDSSENRIFHLNQYFNGNEFVNSFKYENYYDRANNLVASVKQDWIDNKWLNSSKLIYSYISGQVRDTALFQIWTDDHWVNSSSANYEYDEKFNINTFQTKIWQEQQWVDFSLGKYDYDDNNNLVLESFQMKVYNNWENWFRIFYEYDDNNLIHLFGEEWKNGHWIPENEPLKVTNPDGILYGYLAKEIFLYYSPPTSVGNEKIIADDFHLFQNYPNPFNPTTVISYSISEPCLVAIYIYNLLGEKIKTLLQQEQTPGKYQITFDGDNLQSGIYFYKLRIGKFQRTKKMLLLR
ncbi:MAG: T9SS type A sorting domain-containing protein [Melioribacteraceae bacterium]|nr:T9SS type A sorting domain-containing protein [Melioribacteraceae bacterium]